MNEDPFEQLAEVIFDALNRRDIDAFLENVHPDVEFTSMIAESEGEVFRGHEGVRRWRASIMDAVPDARWTCGRVKSHGATGFAEVWVEGTLAGAKVTQAMWQVVELRDGKLWWWAFFHGEADAEAAAAERRGV